MFRPSSWSWWTRTKLSGVLADLRAAGVVMQALEPRLALIS